MVSHATHSCTEQSMTASQVSMSYCLYYITIIYKGIGRIMYPETDAGLALLVPNHHHCWTDIPTYLRPRRDLLFLFCFLFFLWYHELAYDRYQSAVFSNILISVECYAVYFNMITPNWSISAFLSLSIYFIAFIISLLINEVVVKLESTWITSYHMPYKIVPSKLCKNLNWFCLLNQPYKRNWRSISWWFNIYLSPILKI